MWPDIRGGKKNFSSLLPAINHYCCCRFSICVKDAKRELWGKKKENIEWEHEFANREGHEMGRRPEPEEPYKPWRAVLIIFQIQWETLKRFPVEKDVLLRFAS